MACPLCKQAVTKRRNGKPTRHLRPDSTVEICKGYVRRAKGWSVNDVDHIPIGQRVLVQVNLASDADLASFRMACAVLGVPLGRVTPYGRVAHRYSHSGRYMIAMEGDRESGLQISFARDALLWPIPDGVVAFDPSVRGRRLRRAA